MAEILWEKTIDTYQCKCEKVNNFIGKLTVIDTDNNFILDKELVLREPFDINQWELFCREAINQQ